MKRCFTSLTALLCSAAILLCCLPMQALAAEFRMQTAYEDILPDELTAQEEAPAALAEPEAPEAAEQLEPAADASAEPEAAPEAPVVSVLSTGNKSGDFTYSVLSDNTAQITGYAGTAENLIVPDKLDGYTVTEIGKLCFSGNITLVSLKLPDTVTRIGTRAFAYCTNLASINYPLHLESAGDGYNGGFLFDGTRISSITVACPFQNLLLQIPDGCVVVNNQNCLHCFQLSCFYFRSCPSPPIKAVISSMRSSGNGGWHSGFMAMDMSFMGLSSAAMRLELSAPQRRQR